MNIQFNHDEIVQAIVNYTAARGFSLAKSTVNVNLTAGRGSNGYSAHVEVLAEGVNSLEEAQEVSEKVGTTAQPDLDEEPSDSKGLFEN